MKGEEKHERIEHMPHGHRELISELAILRGNTIITNNKCYERRIYNSNIGNSSQEHADVWYGVVRCILPEGREESDGVDIFRKRAGVGVNQVGNVIHIILIALYVPSNVMLIIRYMSDRLLVISL